MLFRGSLPGAGSRAGLGRAQDLNPRSRDSLSAPMTDDPNVSGFQDRRENGEVVRRDSLSFRRPGSRPRTLAVYPESARAYQTAGADTGPHSRADAERSDRSGAGSLIRAQRARWTARQTFEPPTFWGENVSPRFPAHVSPDFAGPSAPVAPASAKSGETCERDRSEVGA